MFDAATIAEIVGLLLGSFATGWVLSYKLYALRKALQFL